MTPPKPVVLFVGPNNHILVQKEVLGDAVVPGQHLQSMHAEHLDRHAAQFVHLVLICPPAVEIRATTGWVAGVAKCRVGCG